MKERRQNDPVAVRQNWERHKYGACKEDFDYQHCKICGATEKLHIDHCHTSDKVRGLLCHLCNVAIGHFRDDPELLRRAAQYLEGEIDD